VGRNQVGRLLSKVRKEAEEMARGLDRVNSILLLLCFESAYADMERNFLRGLVDTKLKSPSTTEEEQFAAHEWAVENHNLILSTLYGVLKHSKKRMRQFDSLPRVGIETSSEEASARIKQLRRQGFLTQGDWVVPWTWNLTNKIKMTEITIVKNIAGLAMWKALNSVYRLLVSNRSAGLLDSAVRMGATVTLEPGNPLPHVNYPDRFNGEAVAKLRQRTPRLVLDLDRAVPVWDSNFKAVSESVSLEEVKGTSSEPPVGSISTDLAEYARGYSQYPGYALSFTSMWGYEVTEFLKVAEALAKLAARQTHGIFVGGQTELLRRIKALSGVSGSVAARVLWSMTWHGGERIGFCPIMTAERKRIFSLNFVLSAEVERLDSAFDSLHLAGIKGERFEQRVRDLFASKGFAVYPTALKLPYQYIPGDVSIKLWHREKRSTDMDVIASGGKLIIVAECKERASFGGRAKIPEQRYRNFAVDLRYKTIWMQQNPGDLSKLLGREWSERLLGSRGSKYLIPILVSNYPLDLEDESLPIILSYSETWKLASYIGEARIIHSKDEHYVSLEKVTRGTPYRGIVFEFPSPRD
jgi:hypothetical protein